MPRKYQKSFCNENLRKLELYFLIKIMLTRSWFVPESFYIYQNEVRCGFSVRVRRDGIYNKKDETR